MANPLDPKAAAKYGDLVNRVYDMFKNDPKNLTPTPAGFDPLWKHIAWIDMKDFLPGGITDPRFYGVVLQATAENTTGFDYAIVIRGTEGTLEWIDDALAVPVDFSPVPGSGRVAYGFDKIYSTLNVTQAATGARLQQVLPAGPLSTFARQIDAVVKQEGPSPRMRAEADTGEPSGKFLVLGHSLGAALATLYVMENASLQTVHKIDTICTYASPRVGWEHFVDGFNNLQAKGLTSWRITNTNDIVTHVPFKILGYRDVDSGTEFSGAKFAKSDWGCMHHMETYQHFLDPVAYPDVPGGCQLPQEVKAAFAQVLPQTRPSIPYSAINQANAADQGNAITFKIDATIPRSSLP